MLSFLGNREEKPQGVPLILKVSSLFWTGRSMAVMEDTIQYRGKPWAQQDPFLTLQSSVQAVNLTVPNYSGLPVVAQEVRSGLSR